MLRFACSFQAGVGSSYASLWDVIGTQPVNNPSLSRWGSAAPYVFYGDFQGYGAVKVIDPQDTWIINMSWCSINLLYAKMINIGQYGNGTGGDIMGMHAIIEMDASGHLTLKTGNSLAVVATSTQRVRVNRFYSTQIKYVCDNTTGRVVVTMDGEEFINYTGDTYPSAETTFPDCIGFAYQYNGGNANSVYQDIAIFDGQAGLTSDTPNPTRTVMRIPQGVGTYNDGTPHSDSTHAYNVRDVPPDGDTSYNEVDVVGDKESYDFTDLPATATAVLGLQVNTDARRTDVGTRELEDLLIISSTVYTLGSYVVPTGYTYSGTVVEVSPATSSQFTVSEVNDSEAGFEVVS